MNKLWRSFFIFSLVTITFSSSVKAQNNNNRFVNKTEQQWVQYYTESQLNEKWSLPIDAGFRWRNNFRNKSQYIVRGAIALKLNEQIKIAAGIGHLGGYNGDRKTVSEMRPHQEINYKHFLGSIELNHRLRIEERFIDRNGISDFAMRFRYSFMLDLFKFPVSSDINFLFKIGNEIFLASGDEELSSTFAQNRLLISPTIEFSEDFSIGITWNNQYAATDDSEVYNQTDVVWIQARHRLKWNKP